MKATGISIIILAAGNGKRMYSDVPKVLHPFAGKPLLEHVVTTAQQLNPHQIYIIYGTALESFLPQLKHWKVEWVKQDKQLGTGHAVLQAIPRVADQDQVLILYGDVPLITTQTIHLLLNNVEKNGIGLLVTTKEDPRGFGRIIRADNSDVIEIVEDKDTDKQQYQIKEINSGIMTAPAAYLKRWLPTLTNHNAQHEYYLTDIVAMAVKESYVVKGVTAPEAEELHGINTCAELVQLERYYQIKQAEKLLEQGVTIRDPARFDLRGELNCGRDVIIDINTIFEGKIVIGNNCHIEPNVLLRNVTIGDHVIIKANSILEDCTIEAHCSIGPFARLRPGTHVSQHAEIGNFIEIKNSKIGSYSKVHHLGYLGDATIGHHVNVGAGTITCNYDGQQKHQTTVGNYSFIGSGTELVAPVTIGDKAYIGAGSTITENVPANQLTLARARQTTVAHWQSPVKAEKHDKK